METGSFISPRGVTKFPPVTVCASRCIATFGMELSGLFLASLLLYLPLQRRKGTSVSTSSSSFGMEVKFPL